MIMNVKSFRHIKGIGMTSGGFSFGGNGKVLQWNGKWEATRGTTNAHKCSAKVSVGMLQGNSLEVGYKVRCKNISWLEEHITLPRHVELSAIWSRFPKIMGMVTQEFTSLAAHPTLGFGMEHDITFGCWTWIWELTYNNSTFRVPVPVVHLGSISNSDSFYRQKLYYGIYCLLLQSTMADLLKDDEDKIREEDRSKEVSKIADALSHGKSKIDAERQSAMMEKIAERKRVSESRRDGLVILKATYWVDPVVESSPVQACLISMDATNQLQFWVSGGKLSLPSIPKSSWLGFYNLQAHQRQAESRFKWDWRFWRRLTRRAVHPEPLPEPQLTIRYSNSGYIYEITVGEKESLVLPNERAQLLGRASFVQ